MIKKGRPPKNYDKEYLLTILKDYCTMTAKEVSEKYGISVSTVYKHTKMAREYPEAEEILKGV